MLNKVLRLCRFAASVSTFEDYKSSPLTSHRSSSVRSDEARSRARMDHVAQQYSYMAHALVVFGGCKGGTGAHN